MLTEQEARNLLAIPNKMVVRQCSWTVESGGHAPPWKVFDSAIKVEGSILEGLRFRARYRPPKTIAKGDAIVQVGESISVALFANVEDRIAAIDSAPNMRHTNKVGTGKPYYGQTIRSDTHIHIWVGEYGYAEPIAPPVFDVQKLFEIFAIQCNLVYSGPIVHPRKGEQGILL